LLGPPLAVDECEEISMKRVLAGMVVAAALSGSAFAADLGVRTYAKAPAMVAAVANWSGLYIGGNVGYGWGNGNTDFSFLPTPVDFGVNNATLGARSTGVTGGAQFGYNWQIGSLVTGLEADIQGSSIKGSARATSIFASTGAPDPGGTFLSSEPKLSWFGTLRGRLGVTVTLSYCCMVPAVWHMAMLTLRRLGAETSSRLPVSARPKSAGRRAPVPNGCSRTIGRPSSNTFTLTSAMSLRSEILLR
jgi:hypothetical protein